MYNQHKYFWPLSLFLALIFQALFYDQSAGLNYLAFSALIFCVFRFCVKPKIQSRLFLYLQFLWLGSTAAVIFANTDYSVFVYWGFLLLFVSLAAYGQIKNLQLAPCFVWSGAHTLIEVFKGNNKTGWFKKMIPFLKFVFLPGFTIFLLLGIYASSNPLFLKSLENIAEWIFKVLEKISFPRVFLTGIGLILAIILLKNKGAKAIIDLDFNIRYGLMRTKYKMHRTFGLTKQLIRKQQVAIFTFLVLNIMIGWMNYLDIQNIWIDFKWDGSLLKSMVHEGTNKLIVAILVSMGLTLFYLNSNLVFLKNTKLFNGLVLLWLMQNVVLTCSVIIRNSIYIDHFSLAYLRIFLYFFLAACCIGLASIAYKIMYKRSLNFLYSFNSVTVITLILISACFNWDKIIAEYNFRNYKKSFVHYTFLSGLNNSALPYLIKSKQELDKMHDTQKFKFSIIRAKEYELINYATDMNKRRDAFLKQWEAKSILEWNYAEYLAYQYFKK